MFLHLNAVVLGGAGGAGGGSLRLGKRDAADDEADEAQHKAERGDGHGVAAQAEFEKANFETGFSLDRRGGLKPLWVPGAFQVWVRGSQRAPGGSHHGGLDLLVRVVVPRGDAGRGRGRVDVVHRGVTVQVAFEKAKVR